MNKDERVVRIDYYMWETMPQYLKEIALKDGFTDPGENMVIAVKTVMTKEERIVRECKCQK
jgi:hypothetical protein